MQIVIGLLTDEQGYPMSVEVFEGNTQDSSTVLAQLEKLKKRFEAENVVFVGDRGMIKSLAIDAINDRNWKYITAITKPQIEKLIKEQTLQISLFCEELSEVELENVRYILKRKSLSCRRNACQ